MKAKTVEESRIIMAQTMMPQDANPYGSVHGGAIMKLIDNAAAVCAIRHCRKNAVTASIDRLDFKTPVFVGELVTLKAGVNMVGRTSMEIGVRVESENIRTGDCRHAASAYLTFVCLGDKGQPLEVPPLALETEEEVRRNREAQSRRKTRLAEKKREQTID
ncbi:MAG: acyl-CoA thioesterase [Pseudomonadota bacterium]